MTTREESVRCANELPTGFGIIGTLVIVEIIYYSFQLWKSCSSEASPKAALTSAPDGSPAPSLARRATRCVRRAARYQGQDLSDEDVQTLTTHMLNHVSRLDNDRLAACCKETPDLPAALESTS